MDHQTLVDGLGDGLIFSVKFIKRDGSVREMQARLGVTSRLKGGQKAYDDSEKNILTVFDMNKEGYRAIKIETIIEIKAHGQVIYSRKV